MKLEDDNYCFVCGRENPAGLKLHFSFHDKKAFAEFTIPKTFQGYKDIIHGGILATILDEAMIKLVIAQGINAVTAEFTVRLKNPLQPGVKATVEAEIIKSGRRLIEAAAYIQDASSKKIAEGYGKLIPVSED